MNLIFITGIGTGIGKTIVSSIVAEALHADYWKPVQAGTTGTTDTQIVQSLITNTKTKIHPEAYRLKMAASPHIAAKQEGIQISLENIISKLPVSANQNLIIEGAGGLLVPLNENEFVSDLIKKLNAKVILVSKNYLGSINHSLLTAAVCKANKIKVCGWIFNDQYLNYDDAIVQWSGLKKIASLPFFDNISSAQVLESANRLRESLISLI